MSIQKKDGKHISRLFIFALFFPSAFLCRRLPSEFRRRYAVYILKLQIQRLDIVESAIGAYAPDTVIGGSQKLGGVLHFQSVYELGKAATENSVEHVGEIGIVIPQIFRHLFQAYSLVVIQSDIVYELDFQLAAVKASPPPRTSRKMLERKRADTV